MEVRTSCARPRFVRPRCRFSAYSVLCLCLADGGRPERGWIRNAPCIRAVCSLPPLFPFLSLSPQFCGICAIGAVIPAYMCIFVGDNFYFSMAMLWLVLAFGGTIVPGATGVRRCTQHYALVLWRLPLSYFMKSSTIKIPKSPPTWFLCLTQLIFVLGVTISCVPKNMRSFASANATLIYNLFGYFAGPTVCGLVADAMGGVQYGFWIVLGSSALGLFFVAWAQYVAGVHECCIG